MRNININLMMLGKNILSAAVKMTFTELDKVAQKYEIELYYSQYHLTDHHEGEARGNQFQWTVFVKTIPWWDVYIS